MVWLSIVWIEINTYEHKDAELWMTSFTQLRKSDNVEFFWKFCKTVMLRDLPLNSPITSTTFLISIISIFKYKSFSIVWIEINSYEHHKDAELLMTSFTQLRKSENVVLFKKKLQNRYLYLLYYLYSLLIAVTTS